MSESLNSGLLIGLIYVLVVLGVGFVSRVSGYFNLAQGAMAMVASYAAYLVSEHTHFVPAILGASLAAGLVLAAVIDIGLARPIRRRAGPGLGGIFAIFVATVSVGTIMEELIRIEVNQGQPVELPESLTRSISRFLAVGRYEVIWLAIVVVVLTTALHIWLARARLGLAVRAVGLNLEVAAMMGVSIPMVRSLAIVVSGITSGIAGFALATLLTGLNPYIGDNLLFTALALFLALGAERPLALLVGGVALGVIGSLTTYAGASQVSDILSFVVIILALLGRSFGLFGKEFARS